jgi:hypothetical protein
MFRSHERWINGSRPSPGWTYESVAPTFHAMDTIDRAEPPAKPVAKPRKEKNVLRAKPVKGEVDWAELSRETIARYPNILAALAEAEHRCAEKKSKSSL